MFMTKGWTLAAVALVAAGTAEAFVPTVPTFGGKAVQARFNGATAARSVNNARAGGLGLKMADKMGKDEINRLLKTKDLSSLFDGNKDWIKKKLDVDPKFFEESAKGQAPRYLWIGCSDARVSANEIVGCEPGELFVHRNVANLVVNNDNSLQSVFQYAVEYLQVEHIIVCGHYDCSGVSSSLENIDLASPLEEWVANIRDVYRLHKEELDAIKNIEQRKRRLVELNAQEQAVNVYKTAVVQRRRLYTHMKEGLSSPKVHACVFDPETGLLRRINTFKGDDQIDELHEVYDLYDSPRALEAWGDLTEYPKRENSPRALFNRMPAGLGAAKQKRELAAAKKKESD